MSALPKQQNTIEADLETAAVQAIDEIKRCLPDYGEYAAVYCGHAAEVLAEKLVALGHNPTEIWIAPDSAIHRWLAIGDYVVDIWELEGDLRLKYWHYRDPVFRKKERRMYQWPGIRSGVRPSDVDKIFTPGEVNLYFRSKHKELPQYLR